MSIPAYTKEEADMAGGMSKPDNRQRRVEDLVKATTSATVTASSSSLVTEDVAMDSVALEKVTVKA